MARPRSTDREALLDAAEVLLTAGGTSELTFGNVAKQAKVSKSTVQTSFGSRSGLIEAMLERWLAQEDERFSRVAGASPSPRDRVAAHLEVMQDESAVPHRRVAALLGAYAATEGKLGGIEGWYRNRFADFRAQDDEMRRLRVAFLAAEGMFFVRYIAGIDVDPGVWADVLVDLKRFVEAR